jgi:hypothetical protein
VATSLLVVLSVYLVGVISIDRLVGRDGVRFESLVLVPKTGWPHGVQEDDDVRWDWPPPAPPAGRAPGRTPACRDGYLVPVQQLEGHVALR